MMADRDDLNDEDPAAAFRQELDNLELNSKPHILMLTMLADDYKDTKAAEIADCIEQRLLQVTPDKKLPTLYLIDSICKNLAESLYIDLFQRKIIGLFCHTFERVDDKIRVLLYKLRQTWNEVFTHNVLLNLDMTVKKLDPNWPVTMVSNKPPENVTRNHLETNKDKVASINAVSKNSDIGNQLLSKHNELLNIQKQLEIQKIFLSNGEQPQQSLTRSEMGKIPKKNKNDLKRKSLDLNLETSNKIKKKDSFDKLPKSISPSKGGSLPKIERTKSKRKSTQSKPQMSPSKRKKNISETTLQLPVAPVDVIPLGSNHHVSVTKWSKPDPRHRIESSSIVASIKSRRSPPRHRSHSPQPLVPSVSSNRSRISPNKSTNELNNNKTTIQTTIPAPNIFSQPEIIFGHMVDKLPNKLPDSWNSQCGTNTNVGFGMDRDYRHEFELIVSEAKKKLNTGAITSADHDLMVREAQRQLDIQSNQCQIVPNPPQFPSHILQTPAPAPAPTSVLIEPHGSVVLYINNELRRLYYIDNIISIVLKAHPDTPFDQLVTFDPVALEPKRVFFSGMTTTVFIDPGTPNEQSLRLDFNDAIGVTFFLPGISIPQRIMLGLPARELIINGRPHQASFGGAGVKIYFECDNNYHEFRLSDSRPLLKFSDEICYNLWHQLVHEAKLKAGIPSVLSQINYSHVPVSVPSTVSFSTQPVSIPQIPGQFNSFDSAPVPNTAAVPIEPAPTDINKLLSQLTAAGIINPIPTAPNSENTSTDSVPKKIHNESITKQYLSLDELKSSCDFVVDQLYSGLQCTNCSLRFSDDALKDETDSRGKTKKSRYARHLDWHFRQNRREKSKPGSATSASTAAAHRRPWYYSIDLWILYKDVNDDIEEDSAYFLYSNSVNSPTMLTASGALSSIDFSQYKEFITDFDSFIESISCDSASSVCSPKLCSVVSGFVEGSKTCSVCNEAFDEKWQEDEEEWRLMNAVRYTTNGDESLVRIYHPHCLKDYIIQQEKGVEDSKSHIDIDSKYISFLFFTSFLNFS